MSDSLNNPPPLSPRATELLRNSGLLVLSILPVLISCLLRRAFAPIDGFCPLDIFHASHSPSEHDLLVWRWISLVVFIALLVAGLFQRTFAVLLLALACLSPLLLALRFYSALSHIH
jgi:hypothetical protein